MKILHINTSQTGGAALCARRINNALVQAGIDSRMLFAEGNNLPQGVQGAIAIKDDCQWWMKIPILRGVVWKLICILPFSNAQKFQEQVFKANKKHLYLHIPYSEYKNIAHHPLVKWADIIHLHWVCGFVDYLTFFQEVKKPIVWTFHDKYPAVGLQHYSSAFYPVPDNLKKLDEYCRKVKRKSLLKANKLYLVAISEMMKNICQNSDVLKGFPVSLIHNGIDGNNFKSYNKIECRKELGLIPRATIFLFSGYSIHDPNKGLCRLIEALEKMEIPNKMLVCIGISNEPIQEASFPMILTGLLTSYTRLSKYYSAADYFISNSYEETFGQTPLESLACGTPVITTPCSGSHDLINQDNGVVCDDFTVDAMVEGIKLAMSRTYDSERIRKDVINRFSYDKISKQYIDLYKSILKTK